MTGTMRCLCVYAGSSFGGRDDYAVAARQLGAECARRGVTVVYGGGRVGLMGTLADAALAAGGGVIGVIPRAMISQERAHAGLTRLIAVDSMHERKRRMADLADAFVALPGGIGTLEETVEVFTWLQLGLQLKPVGLLNVAGFYDHLLAFLGHAVGEGFLRAEHRAMLAVGDDPAELIDRLARTRHEAVPKPVYPTVPPGR